MALASTCAVAVVCDEHPWRRAFAITHGAALVIILVSGFGLLARMGIAKFPWPGWVYFKLVVWLVFGAAFSAARNSKRAKPVWLVVLFVACAAAIVALHKPF